MSSHRIGMNNLINRTESNEWNDRRMTRHLVPQSNGASVAQPQNRSSTLVAEWQDRGPEMLPGLKLWKLRLALSPAESAIRAGTAR